MAKADDVIVKMMVELDGKQSNYQALYRHYYGKEDEQAKYIHNLLVSLCEEIKNRLRKA